MIVEELKHVGNKQLNYKIMNFTKETFRRLKLATPSYFWKIIYFCASLSAIGIGIQQMPDSIAVPEIVKTIAGHLVWVGAIGALIAKSAVKDPNQI
jgi:hypothetical protein